MNKFIKLGSFVIVFVLLTVALAVPASATLLGENGFYYQIDNKNNTAVIAEYSSSNTVVNAPAKIYDYDVVAIANNAFLNNRTITSVTLSDTITSVGTNAFAYCTALEEVTLSNSLTKIKVGTFQNCIALAKVIIPPSVTEIASNAFSGCENLVIYGEKGSYAETFANENEIPFVGSDPVASDDTPDKKLLGGDVNGDGKITTLDALIITRITIDIVKPTEEQNIVADVNGDGRVTNADALSVMRYCIGYDVPTNVGKYI